MDDAKDDQETPRPRAQRRLKNVDLSHIGKKMQMILEREINRLLDESFAAPLSGDSHRKFTNYLKFLPEIKKQEDEFLADLPEEELERLLQKGAKI